jgi:RND family efflux transporter MFP subunit
MCLHIGESGRPPRRAIVGPRSARRRARARIPRWVLIAALPGCLACESGGASRTGGFPPVAVETTILAPAPIERTTEYLATLKSRRSTTLQPMVEGTVTRIAVRSGDRVSAGDPVLEIDSARQRASVASLESLRAAREADLSYARREAERQRSLLDAGASSAQEFEQAQTALESATAQLRAVEEQIREQSVQLSYYQVTAPTAGVIGDVPVRVGDRVTEATVLTTIDSGRGLELYIHVPVRRASALARGLPVRIVDDDGAVRAETAIDFISPQVDQSTQTVLAKAPVGDAAGFRPEQQVRARIAWSEEPGLRIPVVAVSRIGGQFFAFVAEDGAGGSIARQKGVRLGPIVGNDYILLDGLAPGDRLIVSGIQKVRDGAPVQP